MKKAITLSAATLALLVAGVSAVSAASVKADKWNSSTGTIGFIANTQTPPKITNPEAPGETGSEGTKGALAIDYASNLVFDQQHEISAKSETYYAAADTTAFKSKAVGAFVEMHDLRGLGTGHETHLRVTQQGKFKNPNSGAELTGATLSFSSGKVANACGGPCPRQAIEKFTLAPDLAQTVMSTDGTVGQFLTSYGHAANYKENTAGGPISLSVPSGSALKGTFTATLQWDLVTDPS